MKTLATVTRIVPEKGYALALGDTGARYFLFARNFQRFCPTGFEGLATGDRVEFEAVEGPKGLRGVDIRVVPGGALAGL